MKFRYTILYVHDVPATLLFYNRAFGLETAMLHDSNEYGELATGTTKLAFCSIASMTKLGTNVATEAPTQHAFELAFETHEVAAAVQRAVAVGANLIKDATEMPWGQTVAYVRTPDGTLVELCTKVGT
jgi:lactoylglutathione lyase